MSTESTLEHLTAFEENDRLEELKDRTPEDRIDFRLLYDPQVVNPWSEGPNELTRLYFNADRLDGFYVPINFPERLGGDTRSTPIGRPQSDDGADDEAESWSDAGGGEYRIEEGVEIAGEEFDVMWYQESDGADEVVVVAAAVGDTTE